MRKNKAMIMATLMLCIIGFLTFGQSPIRTNKKTDVKSSTTESPVTPPAPKQAEDPGNENSSEDEEVLKNPNARYSFMLFGGGDINPHKAQGSPFGGGQFQVNMSWMDLGFMIQGKNTIYRKISEDSTEINKFFSGGITLTFIRVPEKYNKNFSGTGVGAQINVIWDNYKISPVFPAMAGFYIKGQYNFFENDEQLGATFSVGIKGNLMVASYETALDNSKAVPVIFSQIYVAVNIHRVTQ